MEIVIGMAVGAIIMLVGVLFGGAMAVGARIEKGSE